LRNRKASDEGEDIANGGGSSLDNSFLALALALAYLLDAVSLGLHRPSKTISFASDHLPQFAKLVWYGFPCGFRPRRPRVEDDLRAMVAIVTEMLAARN
jgi:hypothetical protein